MRNLLSTLAIAAFITTGVACGGGGGGGGGGGDAAADPQVTKAADLAKKIEANPDQAEAALKEAGMSVEDFEALMMDIAADPAKTEAFEKAKGG
jgi:hypothetical protein